MRFLPRAGSALCVAVAVTVALAVWGVPPALAGWQAGALTQPPDAVAKPLGGVERISPEYFERLLAEGNVILIDVRPYYTYRQAHLPDAVSIPLDELEGSIARLSASQARIVLYCVGPAGNGSGRAAALLRARGFDRVYCLDGGFERWVASGRVVLVDPTDT